MASSKLTESEEAEKALASELARRKGYELRWVRDSEWNRPHIAAIDPATAKPCAWASHWGGILQFLRRAPKKEDGNR